MYLKAYQYSGATSCKVILGVFRSEEMTNDEDGSSGNQFRLEGTETDLDSD